MDVNNLTIGQARELAALFGSQQQTSELFANLKGEYVIVRSRNEGINAGFVDVASENGIVLSKARRIWWHRPKDPKQSWYEGVANSGLSSDSKVSPVVDFKVIVEDYSITACSKDAALSIQECPAHAG